MNIAVVGANRGIGLEFVKQLVGKHQVYAFCRKTSPALEALKPTRVIEGCDVANESAVKNCLSAITGVSLDWVLHVSGILKPSSMESFQSEDLVKQFEINSVGPLVTARAFLPLLVKGAKIGFLTSRMGSIGENGSGGYYGYRMSKAALNMGAVSMAHELRPKGVTVLLLHPGYVRTEMTGGMGEIDPPESVRGLLKIMEQKDFSESGTFWHTNGSRLLW